MKSARALIIVLLIGISLIMQSTTLKAYAAPSRRVKLITPFPRFEISGGQKVKLELKIINEGDNGEVLDLMILGPKGWETALKSRSYVVKSIYLDENESRFIDFEAIPPPEEKAGTYTFVIKALSRDEIVEASLNIQVDIAEAVAPPGISLSTPYPSVEGPAGLDYEFRVTVWNRGREDRVVYFSAFHPQDWRVNFAPRYEDRLIRSLDFGADESKVLMVTVSLLPDVEPGSYNVTVVAASELLREKLSFILNIIGTYQLELSTPEGLLSIDAMQGMDTPVTLILYNSGTAPLENVHFSSSKPKGWDVNFEPNEVSSVGSASSWEIRATIKPPSDAIPGDYVVMLTAIAEPYLTSDALNFRVTVRGSVAWGLVGAGLIAVLAVALIGIFWRLGRR